MILLTKIKLAIAFQVSLNYKENHQYQKIIDRLEKYRFFVDNKISYSFTEYYILLGEAYYKVTNYKISEGYLLNALEHIEKETKLNEDEKNYLKYYTYGRLYLVYNNLYENIKSKRCLELFTEITFNEKNIRRYIQAYFTLDNLN